MHNELQNLTLKSYEGFEFRVSKKSDQNIETKKQWQHYLVFVFEKKKVYPVYLSKQSFENDIGFLLINNKDRSHYVYIKDFNRFMYNKKSINKKQFWMNCLQCFSSKEILANHPRTSLEING